jgi:hypothetical protein
MWHERGDFLHFNAQRMWNCSDETPYRAQSPVFTGLGSSKHARADYFL